MHPLNEMKGACTTQCNHQECTCVVQNTGCSVSTSIWLQTDAVDVNASIWMLQMGAGGRRQDPPGMEGVYNGSMPGTAEGGRAIQGAPSLMLTPTPGGPTRSGSALARRPATAQPQTAGTARYPTPSWQLMQNSWHMSQHAVLLWQKTCYCACSADHLREHRCNCLIYYLLTDRKIVQVASCF